MRYQPVVPVWRMIALAGLMTVSALLLGCETADDVCGERFANASPRSSIETPDEYISGVERTTDDGTYLVTLVRSTPTPKFTDDYTWLVTVEDASCTVVNDVHVKAEPTMPQHGHGTTPEFTEATLDTADQYTLEDMDLFMPGIWQIEIEVEAEDGTSDKVSWFFDLLG